MAVLIEDVFPVGVTVELLDAVTDEMGVDANLPPGGIVHVHFEKDGRAHGVDVWDSVEAYEQFVESTLMPAMGKVAAGQCLDPSKLVGLTSSIGVSIGKGSHPAGTSRLALVRRI
jgi:hypothetical protein